MHLHFWKLLYKKQILHTIYAKGIKIFINNVSVAWPSSGIFQTLNKYFDTFYLYSVRYFLFFLVVFVSQRIYLLPSGVWRLIVNLLNTFIWNWRKQSIMFSEQGKTSRSLH